MAEIRVENLHKSFGDFTAVKDSNFVVENGEFFVLLGPSGCGKTTTLRMIAGLELPTSGSILLDGDDVTFKRASRRDIGVVFQIASPQEIYDRPRTVHVAGFIGNPPMNFLRFNGTLRPGDVTVRING